MKLEYVASLILAHPFVKRFDQVSYCLNEEEVKIVAQGETSDVIANRKKEDIEGKEGAGPVYATTFYIGLAIEPRPGIHKSSFSVCTPEIIECLVAGAVGPRKLDISYPTTEFTKLVKMWEKFDEGTMGIVVRHIKRSALFPRHQSITSLSFSSGLPDQVFDPGERKLAQKRTKVRHKRDEDMIFITLINKGSR